MDTKTDSPTRRVHLDFHTSPDIYNIGKGFSKANFQQALKAGNVESITVFAKCHHGLCYYPTKFGTMHPHLDFDLTGAMVEAAHEINVKAPVYITAGWSELDAINHPQWRAVSRDMQYEVRNYIPDADENDPRAHCSWQWMCLNDGNGYTKHIYDLTEEVCSRYPDIDGLFYDICLLGSACYCESCQKGMREMGLNPENESDAQKYYILKRKAFMKKCARILKKYNPNGTIFFNSGGADPYRPEFHECQTHFEMENLPTAWGGYNKLPLRAKFFNNQGKATVGMTGKFHLAWGEFGGFKTKEALKYETAVMALYGAGASIGDHMHPDGKMEIQTYENIGYAYQYLEQIAPFCYNGTPITNIGVCMSQDAAVNEGISNILIENQLDFSVVNDNFKDFDTVIVPDGAVLSEHAVAKLNKFTENGGKLILFADALVKDNRFLVDTGLRYFGGPEFDCDYIIPAAEKEGLPNAPMLCNIPGHRVKNIDAEVYAEFITPYFSRTYKHFCGHKNTPHNKDSEVHPAITKKGNVVYLSHSLPTAYYQYGSLYHKRYFMYALSLVYAGSAVEVSGLGSQGRCTAIHQPQHSRFCINLLYGCPVKRGCAEIIEDIMPLYNIEIKFKTNEHIKKVYLPLENEDLEFSFNDGIVSFTVPKLDCHTSIVLEY